jgi:hypothetical protein
MKQVELRMSAFYPLSIIVREAAEEAFMDRCLNYQQCGGYRAPYTPGREGLQGTGRLCSGCLCRTTRYSKGGRP